MNRLLAIAIPLAAMTLAGPASAHHSFAMFDRERESTLQQAVVARWQWTNPHVWLDVTVPAGRPGAGNYSIEGASTGILRRQGWARNSLKAGDRVTVYYSPLKNGGRGGALLAVVLPNGQMLGARLGR